jgi:PucR family transcriptional regulator, proline-responsive transcriptional activator
MSMPLDEIARELGHHRIQLVLNREKTSQIEQAVLGMGQNQAPEPDILHILNIAEFPARVAVGNYVCILGDQDSGKSLGIKSRWLKNPSINILLIQENVNKESLFNEIEALLSSRREYEAKSQVLLAMMAAGKSVEQILDAAYDLFGNLLTLEDPAFNLLYCTRDEHLDPAIITELASQDTEIHYKNILIEVEENSALFNSEDYQPTPFTLDGFSRLKNGIGARVIIENETVAFIAIFEYNHPFNGNDTRLCALLARIVAYKLQTQKKQAQDHNLAGRNLQFEVLLHDILQQRIVDPRLIEDRIRLGEFELAEFLYVVSIKFKKDGKSFPDLPYIMKKLREKTNENNVVIFNDQVVMVLTRSGTHLLRRGNFDYPDMFLKENHLYAGVSAPFRSAKDIYCHYQQAVKSLELGWRLGLPDHIYRFEDLAVYKILDVCATQEDLLPYIHPVVLDLLEYDRLHDTAYANTLCVYLYKLQNHSQAAKELKLTRVTLTQRLNKMARLFDLNMKDENTLFHLRLSFKILEFTGQTWR